VGTYEAGVALGARARRDDASEQGHAAKTDNARLIFGAALAVHALMLVVALATALAFSLIVRSPRAPERTP
jgi:hypothetical protein